MKYSLTIFIPKVTKSNNLSLRTNAFKRNKENKQWYDLIAFHTNGKRPEKPLSAVKITLVRRGKKYLDYDNLVASFKPVVDGLIRSKILKDDSYEITGSWEVYQLKRSPHTTEGICISVEDIS